MTLNDLISPKQSSNLDGQKKRYQDRASDKDSFDFQPSKLKTLQV